MKPIKPSCQMSNMCNDKVRPSVLIHSLWTRPLERGMYGVDRFHHLMSDIWMFALSLSYAMREGYEMELHTDSLGASLLSFLPYRRIHTTLDDIPGDLSSRFWAMGKIWALDNSPEDAVHIDGDVLIKDGSLLEHSPEEKVIVQCVENAGPAMWDLIPIREQWREFMVQMDIDGGIGAQFNTGVLGISDPVLRAEYVRRYMASVAEASRRFGFVLDNNQNLTPDLTTEQLQLYCLTVESGAKFHCVLNEQTPRAAGYYPGYQHLVTSRKYQAAVMDKVRKTLQTFFPDIYNSTLKICQRF